METIFVEQGKAKNMPKTAYDVNRASKKVVFAQVYCYTNVGNLNLEKRAKEGVGMR